MPLTLDQIVEETRQLPTDVVAELVDRIWAARHGVDSEVEKAWSKEIHRRVAEIQSGKVEAVPLDEAMERVRRRLRE